MNDYSFIENSINKSDFDFKNLPKNKIWFTSDTHFGHENIIRYCKRPFENVNEMDETLIDRWNMVVHHDDIVFVIGDFSLTNKNKTENILKKLNGSKVLIAGNHEKSVLGSKTTRDYFDGGIYKMLEIKVIDDEMSDGYQEIVLCHYPMISWNKSHRGTWQFFGHVHGGLDNCDILTSNQLDVGVDSNDFRPISYEEIKEIITVNNINRCKR